MEQTQRRRRQIDRRAHQILASRIVDAPDDQLLTAPEVAQWLGVSEGWLELGRARSYGPPYLKLSARAVRYRAGDVRAWLQERRRENYHAEKARRGGKPVAAKVRRTR